MQFYYGLSKRRLTAFERPSRAGPTSYATNWPATSIFMSAASTSWTYTKTSELPSSGAIKPYARSVLKEFDPPTWHARLIRSQRTAPRPAPKESNGDGPGLGTRAEVVRH